MSGVGPKEELEEIGIKVVHHSPNVGKNMLDHTTVLLDPIFKQDLQLPTGNAFFAEPGRVEFEKKKWLDGYNNGKGEGTGEMTRFGGSAAVAFIKFPEEKRNEWPEWKALSDADRKRFLDKSRPDTEIFYLVSSLSPTSSVGYQGFLVTYTLWLLFLARLPSARKDYTCWFRTQLIRSSFLDKPEPPVTRNYQSQVL